MELRDAEPDVFAGTLMHPDESLELRVTRLTPAVVRAVERATRSTGGAVGIDVVDGFRYSMLALELKRDEIHARVDDLASRGVRVTTLGVDVRANEVQVGVKDLNEQKASLLAAEFGTDKIDIFDGGEWIAVTRGESD
jgi:hypothetical protein